MRLITEFELATKTKTELQFMLRFAFDTAVRNEGGSAERRNALASMENIHRVLQHKFKF